MKMSIRLICSFLVFILAGTGTLAEPPRESIAGIWLVDQQNPAAGRFVKFGDYPPVPVDVQADLDAFNASLAKAPVHLRDGWIEMSKDGRGFGIGSIARTAAAPGVWIWPNWRDATPVVFDQYSYFSFVSRNGRYVALYSMQTDTPSPTVVVDLQDADTHYRLPGVAKASRLFNVTHQGRWAGVSEARTKLVVGEFDPQQPNAGAEAARRVELPTAGRIENLVWVRGGAFLIVEVLAVEESMPKLFVIDGDTLTVAGSEEFAWMFHGGSTVGDAHFYGGLGGQRALITVSPAGELSAQPRQFPNEETGDERPAAASPSGQFVMTYWDDVEVIDEGDGAQSLSYFIDGGVRATPLATPGAALPTDPTHVVAGQTVKTRYFWLSWE